MIRSILVVAAICGYSALAQAGGSFEAVRVLSISISDETDYVLVVAPQPNAMDERYPDPYFRQCKRFEVHGAFLRLKGAWLWTHTSLTRRAHIDALAYLSAAQRIGNIIKFGWVGNGFVAIDEKDPCVVKSRALEIIVDRGNTMVMSYHDVV